MTALAQWIAGLPSPQISPIADVLMDANTASGPINFSISDGSFPPDQLTLTGTSSNPSLIPNANILLQGSGNNRTVTLTPAAGQAGTALHFNRGERWHCGDEPGVFTATVRGLLAAYYKLEGDAQDRAGKGTMGF